MRMLAVFGAAAVVAVLVATAAAMSLLSNSEVALAGKPVVPACAGIINADQDGKEVKPCNPAVAMTVDCSGIAVGFSIEDGDGDDTINGGPGNDNIKGDGDDIIDGGSGSDNISGGGGDDKLRGEEGNDTLNGGPGRDNLNGDDGDDDLNGNAGDDTTDNCNGGGGEANTQVNCAKVTNVP